MNEIYEYIGFLYLVEKDGDDVRMVPLEGQHRAASKAKHIRNARFAYLEDPKPKIKIEHVGSAAEALELLRHMPPKEEE